MEDMNNDKVDKKKLMDLFSSYLDKAKQIINDEDKIKSVASNGKKMISKLRKAPFIGQVIDDYIDMLEMVVAYYKGEYSNLPAKSLVAIVATILYTLSPIDLIPDTLPVIGFVDDAALIDIVRKTLIRQDLIEYRKYRENKERKILYEKVLENLRNERIQNMVMRAIVVGADGTVSYLLSYNDEVANPIACSKYTIEINMDEFESKSFTTEFLGIFTNVFNEINATEGYGMNVPIYDKEYFESNISNYIVTEEI